MLPRLQRRSTAMSAILILSFLGFLACLLFRGATALPWVLAALSFFSLALALLTARMLGNRPGFSANNRPSFLLLLEPLAALMLAAAAVLRFLSLTGFSRWFIGFGGLAGAVCMATFSLQLILGRRPSPLPYMGLTLALILQIIPEFRSWSADPHILDYCFPLFAMLCVLFVSLHLTGFSLDQGKRRVSAFFCMAGIFFCAVALPGSLADVLTYLGYLLFLSATLWSLLAPSRRKQPRPIRAEES